MSRSGWAGWFIFAFGIAAGVVAWPVLVAVLLLLWLFRTTER